MNVFGQSERSWRKARKRAVSPIIATILLVAITVVLAAVLYVLISGLTHGTGGTPIGSAVSVGTPSATNSGYTGTTSTCAVGTTTLASAIKASDWTYTIPIAQSSVTFASVGFEVKSAGLVLSVPSGGTGGYYIVNTANQVAACALVTSASGFVATSFTYPTGVGASATTSLSSLYTIVIDTGSNAAQNPWTSLGYQFDVIGQGSYSGATADVPLQ